MINHKIPLDSFLAQRAEVLAQWETGKDVNLDEALAYQRAIAPGKRFSARLIKAKADGETLIQPRAGVALPEEHLKLLKILQEIGRASCRERV